MKHIKAYELFEALSDVNNVYNNTNEFYRDCYKILGMSSTYSDIYQKYNCAWQHLIWYRKDAATAKKEFSSACRNPQGFLNEYDWDELWNRYKDETTASTNHLYDAESENNKTHPDYDRTLFKLINYGPEEAFGNLNYTAKGYSALYKIDELRGEILHFLHYNELSSDWQNWWFDIR